MQYLRFDNIIDFSMLKPILIFFLVSALTWSLFSQSTVNKTSDIKGDNEVLFYDFAQSEDGFYLFLPVDTGCIEQQIIVFVHGYGAINPMVYGKWIRHLVRAGHPVIYPRYQESIFSPASVQFVPNTVVGIHSALLELEKRGIGSSGGLGVIGHSYGAVISANLASSWKENQLPRINPVLLCQPGTGPFSGGILEDYKGIPPSTALAIIINADDWTVGESFGRKIFAQSPQIPSRILFRQTADSHLDESITASHYETYTIDTLFDTGMRNFTINRAMKVSKLDRVDTEGYWPLFDSMLKITADNTIEPGILNNLENMRDLGTWLDGTRVKPMEVTLSESMEVIYKEMKATGDQN
jgi:pimeloyl-ACP methyl ester carboxylesterase